MNRFAGATYSLIQPTPEPVERYASGDGTGLCCIMAVAPAASAAERQDSAPDSPHGNAICRMVDAAEVGFVGVFLASEKTWAVSGQLLSASGGTGRSVYYCALTRPRSVDFFNRGGGPAAA